MSIPQSVSISSEHVAKTFCTTTSHTSLTNYFIIKSHISFKEVVTSFYIIVCTLFLLEIFITILKVMFQLVKLGVRRIHYLSLALIIFPAAFTDLGPVL
jgi:hypothetical protein